MVKYAFQNLYYKKKTKKYTLLSTDKNPLENIYALLCLYEPIRHFMQNLILLYEEVLPKIIFELFFLTHFSII